MAHPFILELNKDPEFQKFNYHQQIGIRYKLLGPELMKDPEFQGMNMFQRKQILDTLVFAPPAFESGDVQNQIDGLLQRFQSGDKGARNDIEGTLNDYEFNEAWTIKQAADKYIYGPIVDQVDKAMGKQGPGFYEYNYGPDKRKTVAYFNHLMKKGTAEKYGLQSRTWAERFIPGAAGTVADIASLYPLFGAGAASKVVGGKLAAKASVAKAAPWVEKAYRMIAPNAQTYFAQSRVGQAILKEGGLLTFKAVAEGGKDVIRYELARHLATEKGLQITEDRFADIAAVFGGGAARDFFFASTLSLLVAGGKNVAKVIKGYPSMTTAIKLAKEGDYRMIAEQEMLGFGVPKHVLARAPEHVQDQMSVIRTVSRAADAPETLIDGSFTKAQFTSFGSLGETVVQTPKGFRIRRLDDPGVSVTVKNLEELNIHIGDSLAEIAEKNPSVWTDLNKRYSGFSGKHNWLDDALDPGETIRRRGTSKNTQVAVKEDVADLRGKISRGEFVPLRNRQYGSVEELEAGVDRITKKNGVTFRGISDFTPEEMKRFQFGEYIKTEDKVIDLGKVGDPDTYIFAQRVASKAEYDALSQTSKRTIGSSPKNELLSQGYDAAWLDPEETKILLLKDQNAKFVTNQIDPITGVWKGGEVSKGLDNILQGPKKGNVLFIRQKLISKVGLKDLAGDEEMMSKILSSSFESGKVSHSKLTDFARVYLASKGIAPGDYGNIRVELSGSRAAVRIAQEGDTIILKVPGDVDTSNIERVFVSSLIDRLDETSDAIKGITGKVSRTIRGPMGTFTPKALKFGKIYGETLEKGRIFTTAWGTEIAAQRWLNKVVRQSGVGAGFDLNPKTSGLVLSDASGKVVKEYKDLAEAMDDIIPKTISYQEAKRLASIDGIKLTKKVGGGYTAFGRGMEPVTSETLPEMIRKAGIDYKIPARYMPRSVLIDDGAAELTFLGGDVTVGNAKAANKLLDQFEADPLVKVKKVMDVGDGSIYKTAGAGYFVEDPTMKHNFFAKDIKEARRMLQLSLDDDGLLKQIAADKNLKARPDGLGGFHVIADGNYYHVADKAGIKKIFSDNPTPANGPELVDIDGAVSDIANRYDEVPMPKLNKPLDYMVMNEAEATSKLPFRTRMTMWFRPVDDILPTMVHQSGHKPVVDIFRNLNTNLDLARAHSVRLEAQVENIFSTTGEKGKRAVMGVESRKRIYHYMENMGLKETDPISYQTMLKDLKVTHAEVAAGEKLRDLLGRTKYKGLAALFNEEANTFVFDYMPRIKKFVESYDADLLAKMSDMDIARKALGTDNVPRTVNFFGKEKRLNELLQIVVDDDAYSAVKKYITLGMKRKYLHVDWENMSSYMKKNAKIMPPELVATVKLWQEQVLGIPPSFGLKQMRQVGTDLASRLGLDKHVMDDVVSGMFSLQYMAAMGARPWLPFRNMFQIYTTLGPRFGNRWVNKAMTMVSKPGVGDKVYQHLESIQALSAHGQLFAEASKTEKLLGRLTQGSLKTYKNSDDFTRVVAYQTAKLQWDDALGAYKKGLIDINGFAERSGITLLEPDMQARIAKMINKGNWDSALDEYGVRVIRDTMFDYRLEMRPRAFTSSFVGRVFGRYGTYSAGYIANLVKGFKNGSKLQKAAFATRWLANSMALYGAFQSIGINANNFLPYGPMAFTGGPHWKLALDAMSAINPVGYEGRQARGKFKSAVPFNMVDALLKGEPLEWDKVPVGFVPGFFQYRALARAIKTYQDDPLHAFGELMTMPMKPETPTLVSDIWSSRPRRPATGQAPQASWQQASQGMKG